MFRHWVLQRATPFLVAFSSCNAMSTTLDMLDRWLSLTLCKSRAAYGGRLPKRLTSTTAVQQCTIFEPADRIFRHRLDSKDATIWIPFLGADSCLNTVKNFVRRCSVPRGRWKCGRRVRHQPLVPGCHGDNRYGLSEYYIILRYSRILMKSSHGVTRSLKEETCGRRMKAA